MTLRHDAQIAAEITAAWTSIVGQAPAHHDQDFFESGGTSLAAGRLASRLTALYGVRVSLKAIFEASSVSGLVAWLRSNQVSAQGRFLSLSAAGNADPLVVFPDEHGDPAALRAASNGFQRPVLGIRSRGLLGLGAPLTSIDEMEADWLRTFAIWSQRRTLFLAGFGVGCVFARAAANVLLAQGWNIPAVVLVDEQLPEPTTYDAAIANQVRSLATSVGAAGGAGPDTPEALREALARSGSELSDAVFDEIMVRIRVAAANIVAAGTAPPVDLPMPFLLVERKEDRLSDRVETYLADVLRVASPAH